MLTKKNYARIRDEAVGINFDFNDIFYLANLKITAILKRSS